MDSNVLGFLLKAKIKNNPKKYKYFSHFLHISRINSFSGGDFLLLYLQFLSISTNAFIPFPTVNSLYIFCKDRVRYVIGYNIVFRSMNSAHPIIGLQGIKVLIERVCHHSKQIFFQIITIGYISIAIPFVWPHILLDPYLRAQMDIWAIRYPNHNHLIGN